MSRSYKKNPIVKDHNKGAKRFANKKVRRTRDIPDGNQYRKVYPQYNVCDWWSRWTLQECIDRWYRREAEAVHGNISWWKNERTLKDEMIWWHKEMLWK